MTNNIQISTVEGTRTLKTTFENGVHIPHNRSQLVDSSGALYSPNNPIPVTIPGTDIVDGGLLVNIGDSSVITIFGNTLPSGNGSPVAVGVTADGNLKISIEQVSTNKLLGENYIGNESGPVLLAVRNDSSSPLVGNNKFTPLQVDSTGHLKVVISNGGFTGSLFVVTESPAGPIKTLSIVNGLIAAIS